MSRISASIWTSVFLGAGALHLAKPEVFDPLVPRSLPGTQRDWTLGSGVVELGLGASMAATVINPALSRITGQAAGLFLVGVLPGNIQMAANYLRSEKISRPAQAIALARVPLQIPLIYWVWNL